MAWAGSVIAPGPFTFLGAVEAFVPARVRLVTPISMGRSLQVIAPNEGVVAHRERAAGRESGDAGSSPACEAPYLRRHLPIEFLDGPLSLGYRLSEKSRAGSNPAPAAIMAGFPSRLLSVINQGRAAVLWLSNR